jgi:SnoaL-like domain
VSEWNEVRARLDIHDVLARYCRGADRCDAALMQSCFHEDAVDEHGFFNGPAACGVGFKRRRDFSALCASPLRGRPKRRSPFLAMAKKLAKIETRKAPCFMGRVRSRYFAYRPVDGLLTIAFSRNALRSDDRVAREPCVAGRPLSFRGSVRPRCLPTASHASAPAKLRTGACAGGWGVGTEEHAQPVEVSLCAVGRNRFYVIE